MVARVVIGLVLSLCSASAQSRDSYPYARALAQHPGIVVSPYSPGRYVDVRGYKRGDKVRDPFTQKFFLVPETVAMPPIDPKRIIIR